MDPDVEAVPILSGMEGDYHGHAGIRRWWENLLDVFPDFATEAVEVRDLREVDRGRSCGDGQCAEWTRFERAQ